MKLSKAQSPSAFAKTTADRKPKVQRSARALRTSSDFGPWTLDFGPDRRRGVALIITLIMLSIITFMAVTFLVLSQRERSSVNGATDSKMAHNANDAALARVSTELLSRMLLQSNFQDFDLLVSTNYINQAGLVGGFPGSLSPTNVNYDYLTGPGQLPIVNSQDRNINIASLLYNPRPPVFVVTNSGTGAGEFRFYLDLNRNGRFDKNGGGPMVANDTAGNPVYLSTNSAGQLITVSTNLPQTGWVMSNNFVGDPEWIGQLERPQELHSADNRFIARYAYVVVPVSKALDINSIHNRAKRLAPSGEGFLRNQGVGTWEINLAGFLADLNTNMWWTNSGYGYITNNIASFGRAFSDANDLLGYRYGGAPLGYNNLSPASLLFANPGTMAADNIDRYSDGPLMLGVSTNENLFPGDALGNSWSGADNPNHYFTTQDIFDTTKAGLNFPLNLSNLGTSNDTYNAYTYYRLLAQLGTDSPTDQDKLNVNYKNTDNSGNIVHGMETNLVAWSALDFFTNAAAAMFRQLDLRDFNGNLVTVTNIPIYGDTAIFGTTNINYYTPAVHRILQLAANMFDATTNRFINGGPTNYPTVFRPVFRSAGGVAYIAGYVEVINPNEAFNPFLEPQNFVKTAQPLNTTINMYGVPWVIGAKKGFPNFNEFSMENPLTVSRKLQFTNSVPKPPWTTNEVFDFSITNSFGIEGWNSYTNAYGRSLRLVASNELSIILTNQFGFSLLQVTNLPFGIDTNFTGWPAWTHNATDNSFKLPLYALQIYTNGIYTPSSIFRLTPPRWDPTFVPHMWLVLQFKLRYILIDTSVSPNRIIDFVNLESLQPPVDVAAWLENTANGPNTAIGRPPPTAGLDAQWDTNLLHGTQVGILNQINASLGAIDPGDWKDPLATKISEEGKFRARLNNSVTNNFQAPYTPTRTIYQRISWQANDPLVHYMAADLTSTNGQQANFNIIGLTQANGPLPNLIGPTRLNFAYQPWGGMHWQQGGGDRNADTYGFDFNVQVKDPQMEQSENWDFPTNRLPNIGWLGRIHRGTPWQTVFMKPASINNDLWRIWSNDNALITNGTSVLIDAPLTHPTADYGLFDLFTTSMNDNAARGRLNVNQTNLAAWSAVLTGVNVLSNAPTGPEARVVDPAGSYDPANPSQMARIWQGINAARANTNNVTGTVFLNHIFQHAGDVLATPELTVASPFINTNGVATVTANGVNDEIMERIPQQIMSLLTLNQEPRFVIYSFGQTLHPANHSLVIGGTFNGLCTNYQITAESATRAVVRVEGTPDERFKDGKVDSQGRSYPPHIVVEQYNVMGPD